MKFIRRVTMLPALLLMMVGAYGQEVHYNYDRAADFAAYKTYQWAELPSSPPKDVQNRLPKIDPPIGAPPLDIPGGGPFGDIRGGAQQDQLIEQSVKRSIDEQLAQKGLVKVETGGDLLVVYQAAIHEEKSVNLTGMGWGGRGYELWDGSVQGQTSTVPVGTIVVNLYDPVRKQLIWRGDATKTVDLKKDPDKNYKNLQKAMAKLFKNYPPERNK